MSSSARCWALDSGLLHMMQRRDGVWWCGGPAGPEEWQVWGGVRSDLGGRMDGHWVQEEVGRAVMRWLGQCDGEFSFECVSLRYTFQVRGTLCGKLISPGFGGYLWPSSQ